NAVFPKQREHPRGTVDERVAPARLAHGSSEDTSECTQRPIASAFWCLQASRYVCTTWWAEVVAAVLSVDIASSFPYFVNGCFPCRNRKAGALILGGGTLAVPETCRCPHRTSSRNAGARSLPRAVGTYSSRCGRGWYRRRLTRPQRSSRSRRSAKMLEATP